MWRRTTRVVRRHVHVRGETATRHAGVNAILVILLGSVRLLRTLGNMWRQHPIRDNVVTHDTRANGSVRGRRCGTGPSDERLLDPGRGAAARFGEGVLRR